MSTLGKSTTPTSATHGWINSNSKQVAMLFTVPSPGGIFTSVSFWAATATSGFIWGVIWDIGANVLAHGSGVNTTGGASHNPGPGGDGQFHTDTFATPVFIAGGTQIYIGWQNNDATSTYWAYNGGDHSPDAIWRGGVTGAPVSLAGATTESPVGAVAAYATYTPAGGYVFRIGSGFVAGPPAVARSGSQVQGPGYVLRSGIWVPSA